MSLLWVRAATYPVHVEPPPVEELPAHEFVKKYPPGAYGGTWDAVAKDPEFHEGGDYGWDLDELGHSLVEHGMHTPVEINGFGEVGDGHHRVVKALETGTPVRFQDWSKEPD